MIRPVNIQRPFPDIIPAPLRTKGESEMSAVALSCASIETISRSGGIRLGTNCIQFAKSIARATTSPNGSFERFSLLVGEFSLA